VRVNPPDPGTGGAAATATHPHRWRALYVGVVASFMTLLDVSVVNVAVPSIDRALDASPADLQWILSGYTLAFGLVLVPAGRLGDIHGRQVLFCAGLALFTAASALSGLAQNSTWLILSRILQGAAAGLVNPQVTGLIQELFQGRERDRPFGTLGAVVGVSTAIGPLLGGLLIQLGGMEHGWRWVFFVNVPVGIVAVLLGRRYLPGPDPHRRGGRLDPVGVLLLATGVTLVLLPMIQRDQWRGAGKWLLIPAGLAVLAGFTLWERRYRRRDTPLFDLALFRLRSYGLGTLISLVYFAGFTAIFFVYALYLQTGLGYSPLAAGLAITPFACGAAVSAIAGGRYVHRLGRPMVAGGLAMVALGLGAAVVLTGLVPGRPAPFVLALPLLFAGLGSGLVITPNQNLSLSQVPVAQAGSAAGMLQTAQRIGASAGIAGIGAVFFAVLADRQGAWADAFRQALVVSVLVVLVTLVIAVVDSLGGRRRRGASTDAGNRPG